MQAPRVFTRPVTLALLCACLLLAACVPLRREPAPPDPWEAPPRRAQ